MKKLWIVVLAVALSLGVSGLASADEGWKEVKAEELKQMMDAGDVMVINPLSKIEFNDLHIEGSVNIPMETMREDSLPADKEKKLAFYCLGRK